MPTNRPNVWLIGEVEATELTPAAAWLMSSACCEEISDASVAAAEAQRGRPGRVPDALVFCLTRPGQIARSVVEGLQRAFPLARFVALLGPWCEGEVRSGRPWPSVTRIYWHQWRRLIPEVAGLHQPAAPRLPRSATEVDVLLSRPAPLRAKQPALIGVVSRRLVDFEAIALAFDVGGHHAVWIGASDARAVVKLDALVVDAADTAPIAHDFCEHFRPLPTLVLGHFLRPDESNRAAGSAILAKPYLVSDVLAKVEELLSGRRSSATGKGAAA